MTRKSATGILGALLDQGKRMNSGHLLVLCTCPDKGVATAISTALLDKRLAACVNHIEGIESLYRWEGKLQRNQEVLLMIKTVTE